MKFWRKTIIAIPLVAMLSALGGCDDDQPRVAGKKYGIVEPTYNFGNEEDRYTVIKQWKADGCTGYFVWNKHGSNTHFVRCGSTVTTQWDLGKGNTGQNLTVTPDDFTKE